MDSYIEAIRLAIQPGATDEAKQSGIHACRAILAALEPASGEPPLSPDASAPRPTEPAATPAPMPDAATAAAHPPMPPAPAPAAASPSMPELGALIGALRGMPPEQLLDLAIARLRAALPAGSTAPTAAPVRFHLVPLQHLGRPK